MGNAAVFPVTLQASAPVTPGNYTWGAAWFGGVTSGGGGHLETRVPVNFTVLGTTSVPEEEVPYDRVATWGRVKALFR